MGGRRKARKLEPFAPKSLFTEKQSPVTVCRNGLYCHQDKQNYKNQQKQLIIYKNKMGKIKIGTKRKTSNGQQEQCVISEQCAGGMNSA